MQLDSRAFGMDPVLGSSFFAAIDMFSHQIFEQDTPVIQLDYGQRIFTIIHGVQTNLVAVCFQKLSEETTEKLDSLLGEFELEWLQATEVYDFDESFTDVYVEAFGEVVMQKLSFQELPDSWVPYFTIKPDTVPDTSSSILPFITGSRSVKEIRDLSGASVESIILELSRLWAQRVIRFRNMLSFKDFLSARARFVRYIQAGSSETKNLKNLHPEIVGIVPRLAGLIDGRRTVQDILSELSGQYDEREVLRALDYLLEMEVIEALTPEKRRILLAKELLEAALRSAEEVYGVKEVASALRAVMKRIKAPETLGQLHLKDDSWSVDFDFKMLDGIDPKRLVLMYGEWMKILAQFANTIDRKRLNEFINILTKILSESILNRYTSYDLTGTEEFAYWLEQLVSENWPRGEMDRTYPLEKIGNSVLEDLVHALVARGQSIYGSEIIVGISGLSGIPLVDGLPIEHVNRTRTEAFKTFLVEYSRLGPAAKLTLLILSRQRDLALPNEITF